MPDKEKVLCGWDRCSKCLYPSMFDQQFKDCEYTMGMYCRKDKLISETVELLKERELQTELKQKMWNAFYAEEDEYEKKFVGKEEHHNWFTVYRPWLQKGFDIAINVIAEWEGR